MDEYARIDGPHYLAARSMRRAADVLDQVASDPTTWFFVILDLHRALNCALVAALAGPAEVGAYSDKLQAKWDEYYEKSRTCPAQRPNNRVLPFVELLSKAESGPRNNALLQLPSEQHTDLLKLNDYRDDLEHVKPGSWSLAVGGLPRIGANAARTFATLLETFAHRLEEEKVEQVRTAISKFEQLGIKHPSLPPKEWTQT